MVCEHIMHRFHLPSPLIYRTASQYSSFQEKEKTGKIVVLAESPLPSEHKIATIAKMAPNPGVGVADGLGVGITAGGTVGVTVAVGVAVGTGVGVATGLPG
jgi:hypothetical protein